VGAVFYTARSKAATTVARAHTFSDPMATKLREPNRSTKTIIKPERFFISWNRARSVPKTKEKACCEITALRSQEEISLTLSSGPALI
jgi:hypothetical protein